MSFLALGLDSFIACFAVGALLGKKAWIPFALLFGVLDAGAFLAATAFHFEISEAVGTAVSVSALVALGVYLIGVAVFSQKVANTRWVWALPIALTVDNISFGLAEGTSSAAMSFTQQLVSSSILAFAGVMASVAVVRTFPKVQANRVLTSGLAGAATLIAVPVLLALD
ncbi:hypothetical protein [Flexivirga sp. B27]